MSECIARKADWHTETWTAAQQEKRGRGGGESRRMLRVKNQTHDVLLDGSIHRLQSAQAQTVCQLRVRELSDKLEKTAVKQRRRRHATCSHLPSCHLKACTTRTPNQHPKPEHCTSKSIVRQIGEGRGGGEVKEKTENVKEWWVRKVPQ